MAETAIVPRLAEAIHTQTLAEIARQHPTDPLAQEGMAACAAISAHMRQVQSDALAALDGAGVSAGSVPGAADEDALQIHQIGVSIARSDLGTALNALSLHGFNAAIPMTPARIKTLIHGATQIPLVRFDAVTTRLVVHLDGQPSTLLPMRLRPGLVDLGFLDLPSALSSLYLLVKPLRVLWERVTGQRSPNHDIDFLGTPDALIAPILEAAGVGPSDLLFDLGCGDGRVVIRAAEAFGCRSIGVEHHSGLVARAKAAVEGSNTADRIEIREGDALGANLTNATVVFMFLPRALLAEILPKMQARLGTHVRLVAHEQARLEGVPEPDAVIPVMTQGGITVVRIWKGAV